MTAKTLSKTVPAKKVVTKTVATKTVPVKKLIATKTLVASVKKPVKAKLVRDSFTMPKDEYQVLGDLKVRMTKLMQPVKKSELLRAGLKTLASMSDAVIKKAMSNVPAIKTGRPAKVIKK